MSRTTRIVVALLYPLVVVAAVVLLAAVQQRSVGGIAFDTWRLNHLAARAVLAADEVRAAVLRGQDTGDRGTLATIQACLKLFDEAGQLRPSVAKAVLDEVNRVMKEREDPDMTRGDVYCILKGWPRLSVDFEYFKGVRDERLADIVELRKKILLTGQQIDKQLDGQQQFAAFIEMEKTWYARIFVIIPYDLMVLFMVMAMGALGGMVRLLRDYGDAARPSPQESDYFFIPLIGLVVAIGGYILAKTGLLLLSTGKEEASLSPFMIGLVGIISGLTVREMIDALARAGSGLLAKKGAEGGGAGAAGQDGAGDAAVGDPAARRLGAE